MTRERSGAHPEGGDGALRAREPVDDDDRDDPPEARAGRRDRESGAPVATGSARGDRRLGAVGLDKPDVMLVLWRDTPGERPGAADPATIAWTFGERSGSARSIRTIAALPAAELTVQRPVRGAVRTNHVVFELVTASA